VLSFARVAPPFATDPRLPEGGKKISSHVVF
jgi:hypothetical protein